MKRSWMEPGAHPGGWQEIKVELDRLLCDAEVFRAAGCIGYALRQPLHGESLSEPERIKRKGGRPHARLAGADGLRGDGRTIVRFSYDSTKGQADDPSDAEAFALAHRYINEGSPVRTTDRAGAGTAGTRLCEGLGEITANFWVR